MASQPKVSWSDISVGPRAAEKRQRVHINDWWRETIDMVDRGYRRFWRRRGKEAPRVSTETLESGSVPLQLSNDDKLGPGRKKSNRRPPGLEDDPSQL